MKSILYILPLFFLLSCGEKKFTPTEKMIAINESTQTLELKKGDVVYYQAKEHASVGIGVGLYVEQEEILKIIDFHEDHENPDWEKTDGGDRALITFVLKALKEGSTEISIKSLYRGDVKNEQIIVCNVTKH